ncbi:MAG TPA: thioesterase [Persephonella sp.]|uniref:Nter region of initiation factor eif-2b alpha subunit 1 from aquifex aeolicus n=1 Tax=Persephonella marina (strain DSM 14350 / EX-H1) TaxID=123214 RepID=C0QP65_PERMH|nr:MULTISPECIES: hotdog domain-containing protein [Persephonella]ACO03065.1 nter region of initiation factor eif-2b alpha subunit 1 from aquifex aeolicus [Persephonella marina EX-H1]HCB69923.1 thioesterase [Persephonella sp.]
MQLKTHLKINKRLCGEPIAVETDKYATVVLKTEEEMAADEKGLVHGGFIFGAADYCAMISVNHPNVVLAKAEVKFIKPVKVGKSIIFEGTVLEREGRKRTVEVIGKNESDQIVFSGKFYCVITEKHVLD